MGTEIREGCQSDGQQLRPASTLEVLDGIRDLGLQEIGMRWAWMEGVTYKHWAKYHDLKRQVRFLETRGQLRRNRTMPAANDVKSNSSTGPRGKHGPY